MSPLTWESIIKYTLPEVKCSYQVKSGISVGSRKCRHNFSGQVGVLRIVTRGLRVMYHLVTHLPISSSGPMNLSLVWF